MWAVSAWPLFNFLAANWDSVFARGPAALFGVVSFTLALGGLGHILCLVIRRMAPGVSILPVWLTAICLFFGYSTIRDWSGAWFESVDLRIPPFVGFVLVAIVMASLAIRAQSLEGVRIGAAIFCLGAGTLSLGMLIVNVVRFQETPEGVVRFRPAVSRAVAQSEVNIIYVILDAYPGKRGLQETFGFDNTPFLSAMHARGFLDVSSERSNYIITAEELGAIFALDYLPAGIGRVDSNPGLLYPTMLDGLEPPPLLSHLQAAGYTTWHSASMWGECPGRHFRCLGQSSIFVPNYITEAYLAKTPLGRPLLHILGTHRNALDSIANDLDVLWRSKRGPMFVFVHHLSPHPPYLTEADCAKRDPAGDSWNAWDDGSRHAFLGALQCVNLKTVPLIDAVLRLDPDALIVLQGDHGSAFTLDWTAAIKSWPPGAIRERTSFLNLVHAPKACAHWLDRPMGQINTARFVVACAEGRAPDYLAERTYLGSYEGPDKNLLSPLVESGAEVPVGLKREFQ